MIFDLSVYAVLVCSIDIFLFVTGKQGVHLSSTTRVDCRNTGIIKATNQKILVIKAFLVSGTPLIH